MAMGQFFSISTAGNNGLECRVYVNIRDQTDNTSIIGAELQFRKTNGFTTSGNTGGSLTIHGSGGGVTVSGNKTLPGNGTWVSFGNAPDQRITHGADGTAPYTEVRVNSVSMNASGDFDTPVSGTISLDSSFGFADYSRPPGQVATPTIDQITASQARINWTKPTAPTSIIEYDLHVCTDTTFGGGSSCPQYYWTGNANLNKTVTGLAAGTKYYTRVRAKTGEGTGAWSPTASFVTIPGPPTGVKITNPTTTELTVSWTAPSAEVTGYFLDWSKSSTFASGVTTVTLGKVLTTKLTGLTPGTTHYVRVRAKNASGTGANSSPPASQTTLPAVPPGLTVVPQASGTSAVLTFSPPGGVTGVSKYVYERRVNGTTTPVTSAESTTTTKTVTGLTPGTKYDWRASAWIGTYQSPWSNWLTATQPKPNTDPGDYFDGATPDTGDEDYGWTGTANNSTSTVTGKGVKGWLGQGTGAAPAVMQRVIGGYSGNYAARVVVKADATAVGGLNAGTTSNAVPELADVSGNALYVGSMYVMPNRSQSLALNLFWRDAGNLPLDADTIFGASVLCPANVWTRVSVSGVSPANAEYALIRVTDAGGSGWSLVRGGDTFDLDSAMITLNEEFPYFDGDTADSAAYRYDWTAAANASPSTRTSMAVTASASSIGPVTTDLTDPDCSNVPSPPRPPVVPSDCIEDVGIWRRYYVEVPAVNISDWLSVVPTLEIETGAFVARQVRVRYYANPFNYPANQIDTNGWCAEQIISYMPASSILTLDGVTQRTWAEVNGGSAQSADHLLYGTGGQPATWPILSCGIAYLISLEVPTDAPEGNITPRAYVTTRS